VPGAGQNLKAREDYNMINYDDFKDWHTANRLDHISDKTIKKAYYIYTMLYNIGGKEYADDKICGHPIWNEERT